MQRWAHKLQDSNKKASGLIFKSTFVLLPLLLRIRLLSTASSRHPPQACLVSQCVLFVLFFPSVAAVPSGQSFAIHAKNRFCSWKRLFALSLWFLNPGCQHIDSVILLLFLSLFVALLHFHHDVYRLGGRKTLIHSLSFWSALCVEILSFYHMLARQQPEDQQQNSF